MDSTNQRSGNIHGLIVAFRLTDSFIDGSVRLRLCVRAPLRVRVSASLVCPCLASARLCSARLRARGRRRRRRRRRRRKKKWNRQAVKRASMQVDPAGANQKAEQQMRKAGLTSRTEQLNTTATRKNMKHTTSQHHRASGAKKEHAEGIVDHIIVRASVGVLSQQEV